MSVYFKQFRLSERHGALAAVFISFALSGCNVDVSAISSDYGGVMLTNTGTVVGCAAAGGSLFMAAGQLSPVLQRFVLATALTVGAFFMGNLSPQIFPAVFAGDGPLFYDLPDILVIALLCVAGFFAVLNKTVTSRKLVDIRQDVPDRPRSSRPDRGVEVRSAGLTDPRATSADFLEFSQDALVVVNAEGVVLELNRKAETMFGWKRRHLIGLPIEILIPHCELARHMGPNDPPVHYAALRTVAPERRKLRGIRKNGTTFAIEVSLSPGRSDGAYAVVASIRTVTQPIQTSAALQQCGFVPDQTIDITKLNQTEQQRHVLYVSLERRLAGLIDNSVQSVDVPRLEQPALRFGADASPSFEAPESRFNESLAESDDSHWAARWAGEEKKARASALSLLGILDDMKGLREVEYTFAGDHFVSDVPATLGLQARC